MKGEPIIQISALRKHFPVKNLWGNDIALVKALDGVDLSINEGKTFGIVGESGCGKTTLMRTLLRLVEPTSGSVVLSEKLTKAQFTSNNLEELKKNELRKFRRQIGVVFQDLMGALNPRMLIKDIVGEPLILHGQTENLRDRVVELLNNVGLGKEHLYRYPHEFSGGQRQRIVIARALVVNPKIIIADEPVSMLDVSIRAEILELMNEIQKKNKISFIYITHDLATAKYFADRIIILYEGKIVEMGNINDVLTHPKHPYTQALIDAISEPNPSYLYKEKKINWQIKK